MKHCFSAFSVLAGAALSLFLFASIAQVGDAEVNHALTFREKLNVRDGSKVFSSYVTNW